MFGRSTNLDTSQAPPIEPDDVPEGLDRAAFAARRLMRRLSSPDRWAASLIWLIACGLAADWSGLHFMVGAFLSGAVLDRDLFDAKALDRFRDVVLLTVMPVFFLSTGLKTSWQAGGLTVFAGRECRRQAFGP